MSTWKISGFDGSRLIYERTLPGFSEAEVSRILQRLACRYLSDDEIVNASLRSNSKQRNSFLEVKAEGGRHSFLVCGENPFYTARFHK